MQDNVWQFLGKIFIKDFLEELEMQEIKVTEEEVKKISQLADSEGQVRGERRKSYKTLFTFDFPVNGCKNFRRRQSSVWFICLLKHLASFSC